jgi:hypothetical protein
MSEHARERSEQIQYCRSRRMTTTSDSRCSRRRSAGGDGGTMLFRSARSDEGGGNPANIAASGASNQTQRDARAANLKNGPGLRWGARCGTSTMDEVWR